VYVAELVYVLLGMPEGRRGWLSAILIKYGDFVPLLSVMAYKVNADMRVQPIGLFSFSQECATGLDPQSVHILTHYDMRTVSSHLCLVSPVVSSHEIFRP
jgi:hypothetical protein